MRSSVLERGGLDFDVRIVALSTLENRGEAYRREVNPRGEVPAIEDDGKVIWDSAACLVYIARKYGGEQWLGRSRPRRALPR